MSEINARNFQHVLFLALSVRLEFSTVTLCYMITVMVSLDNVVLVVYSPITRSITVVT